MKLDILRILAVLVAALLVGIVAAAQHAPAYDINQEAVVNGKAIEKNDYVCPVSGTVGTHIILKTAEGTVEGHVASSKFLREYGINLAVGDELEITGMKTKVAGRDALLVRRIQRGNEIYTFRDKKGRPLW